MQSKKIIFLMLLSLTILYSCKNDSTTMKKLPLDNTSRPTIAEAVTKVPTESYHEEWKIVESEKHYCIERMGLREYNDYYRCKVYDDKKELIYSEIIGELKQPPDVSILYDTVDIHFGYGTNAFSDKYINYKEDLQSIWMNNIYGKGKQHVLTVGWDNHSNTKLIVKHMYIQHQEKEYPFPHIKDGCEITKCEFRNNDEEIYIEYTDKDTQKIENKTISLKDFK